MRLPGYPSDRWTPDLGRDIGSATWLAELLTLIGLLALPFAIVSALPPLAAHAGALPMPLAQARQPQVDRLQRQPMRPAAPAGAANRRSPEIVATTGSGSIAIELRALGVSDADAGLAEALVARAIFPDRLAAGTRLFVVLGAADAAGEHSLGGLRLRARLDLALALRRSGDRLALDAQAIPVDATPFRIGGTVGTGLAQAARDAGMPVRAVRQLLAGLADSGNPAHGLLASDRFDAVVDHRRAADGPTEAGDLIFASIVRGQAPLAELVRWGRDGRLTTLERSHGGNAAGARRQWPVSGGRLTSGYGPRFHPVLNVPRWHRGIDIGAPAGTPIHAVGDGLVSFAARNGGLGNYVRIEHANGMATGYAHLGRIAVASGLAVRAGQLIGTVGSTGLSTGPHLHYEVYHGARTVDPRRAHATLPAGRRSEAGASSLEAGIAALKSLIPAIPERAQPDRRHVGLR